MLKSPMLNLEDIEWKNLVMHWSRSQDEVLSMKSHDNLNFYFSTCALWIFFAGNLLEEEFRFEEEQQDIANMLSAALLLLVPVVLYHCTCIHTWFIM